MPDSVTQTSFSINQYTKVSFDILAIPHAVGFHLNTEIILKGTDEFIKIFNPLIFSSFPDLHSSRFEVSFLKFLPEKAN